MISELKEFLKALKKQSKTWNVYYLALIKHYKYWDKFLSLIFKYSTRCYYRKGPLEIEKLHSTTPELQYFSKNFGRFSTSRTLIGKVTNHLEDVDLTKKLLNYAYKNIKKPFTCELVTSEILAKVMAYRNLSEGMQFLASFVDENENIQQTTFTVEKVFDLWQKHVAFGLQPEDPRASPILLFRGTDFSLFSESGRASIISDLDPEGPGRRLFYNSRSILRKWLQKKSDLGRKAKVMGHSLGGVLTTYTILYEYDLINNSSNEYSYSFNPPGISEELIEEWKKIPTEEKPLFKTLVTRGDIISKFGSLIGDVYEVSTNKPLSPVIAHEQLIFSQPTCYLTKVDIDKENFSHSRKYYSNLQKQTTSLVYRFGLRYIFPNPYDV